MREKAPYSWRDFCAYRRLLLIHPLCLVGMRQPSWKRKQPSYMRAECKRSAPPHAHDGKSHCSRCVPRARVREPPPLETTTQPPGRAARCLTSLATITYVPIRTRRHNSRSCCRECARNLAPSASLAGCADAFCRASLPGCRRPCP
jgi:hypothetical protein